MTHEQAIEHVSHMIRNAAGEPESVKCGGRDCALCKGSVLAYPYPPHPFTAAANDAQGVGPCAHRYEDGERCGIEASKHPIETKADGQDMPAAVKKSEIPAQGEETERVKLIPVPIKEWCPRCHTKIRVAYVTPEGGDVYAVCPNPRCRGEFKLTQVDDQPKIHPKMRAKDRKKARREAKKHKIEPLKPKIAIDPAKVSAFLRESGRKWTLAEFVAHHEFTEDTERVEELRKLARSVFYAGARWFTDWPAPEVKRADLAPVRPAPNDPSVKPFCDTCGANTDEDGRCTIGHSDEGEG